MLSPLAVCTAVCSELLGSSLLYTMYVPYSTWLCESSHISSLGSVTYRPLRVTGFSSVSQHPYMCWCCLDWTTLVYTELESQVSVYLCLNTANEKNSKILKYFLICRWSQTRQFILPFFLGSRDSRIQQYL